MRAVLSKEDLAKYPFTVEAAEYIKRADLTLSDLVEPGFRLILDRAVERVKSAIELGRIKTDLSDVEVEILSYPTAMAILSIIGEPALSRRYAVAEAKRIYEELRLDDDLKIAYLCESNFDWRVRFVDVGLFEIYFVDYLKTAPLFHAPSWKLVNRLVFNGWVRIRKHELARLTAEAVRVRIVEKLILPKPPIAVPPEIMSVIDDIRRLFESRRKIIRAEEEHAGPVVEEAFPPCIRAILSDLLKGSTISHMARFALTAFLLNVGKSVDEVVELFSSSADFSQSITRYQVEHIAGLRGSHIKYSPPSCSTLRTFGLCIAGDPLCNRVKHPLTYYKIKIKERKKGESGVE